MIDDVFAVIADPTRRQILQVLAAGERPVGDLVDELGVSQPTVSKHLKVLRTSGLVETQAVGQKRFYSLTPEPLQKVSEWIESLFPAPEESAVSPESAQEPYVPAHPAGAESAPQSLEEELEATSTAPDEVQEVIDLGEEGERAKGPQPRHSRTAVSFTPLRAFTPEPVDTWRLSEPAAATVFDGSAVVEREGLESVAEYSAAEATVDSTSAQQEKFASAGNDHTANDADVANAGGTQSLGAESFDDDAVVAVTKISEASDSVAENVIENVAELVIAEEATQEEEESSPAEEKTVPADSSAGSVTDQVQEAHAGQDDQDEATSSEFEPQPESESKTDEEHDLKLESHSESDVEPAEQNVEPPVSLQEEPATDFEPESADSSPHQFMELPPLPSAPEEDSSEQRGLLATLTRWGRRRTR